MSDTAQPSVTVVIKLELPAENLHDFTQAWEYYRESLTQYATVTEAIVTVPPQQQPLRIDLVHS